MLSHLFCAPPSTMSPAAGQSARCVPATSGPRSATGRRERPLTQTAFAGPGWQRGTTWEWPAGEQPSWSSISTLRSRAPTSRPGGDSRASATAPGCSPRWLITPVRGCRSRRTPSGRPVADSTSTSPRPTGRRCATPPVGSAGSSTPAPPVATSSAPGPRSAAGATPDSRPAGHAAPGVDHRAAQDPGTSTSTCVRPDAGRCGVPFPLRRKGAPWRTGTGPGRQPRGPQPRPERRGVRPRPTDCNRAGPGRSRERPPTPTASAEPGRQRGTTWEWPAGEQPSWSSISARRSRALRPGPVSTAGDRRRRQGARRAG